VTERRSDGPGHCARVRWRRAGTGPGSVERELCAAIDRIAALEDTVRKQEAELAQQAAELADFARWERSAARYERAEKTLLFEMYGGSPADYPAWGSTLASLDFSRAWARECVAAGLQVEALDRYEKGVATPDEAKQMRFAWGAPAITGDDRDIHTVTRNSGALWTLEELLVHRRSFIIAMEQLLGSRTESGDYVPGKPSVRGRVLVSFEAGVPGFADVAYDD